MSLSILLSKLNALSKLHQFFHWKASGEIFYQDHLLAERLYDEVDGVIDSIAEKAVGLFGQDSIDLEKDAKIVHETLAEWKSLATTTSLPELSFVATEEVINLIYELKDQLGDKLTGGLSGALDNIADTLETHIYLLQQRIEHDDGKKITASSGDIQKCHCRCSYCTEAKEKAKSMGTNINSMKDAIKLHAKCPWGCPVGQEQNADDDEMGNVYDKNIVNYLIKTLPRPDESLIDLWKASGSLSTSDKDNARSRVVRLYGLKVRSPNFNPQYYQNSIKDLFDYYASTKSININEPKFDYPGSDPWINYYINPPEKTEDGLEKSFKKLNSIKTKLLNLIK